MNQTILLRVIICCWLSATVSCDLNSSFNCTAHKDCDDGMRCCGDCGRSFCCDFGLSPHPELNALECDNSAEEEVSWDSSVKMLGVIIGGMVGSFAVAMLAHTLVRKFVKRRQERRQAAETSHAVDNAAYVESPPDWNEDPASSLPPYESIHLYQKTDLSQSSVVNELASEEGKVAFKPKNGAGNDEESPPPCYSASVHASNESKAADIATSRDVDNITCRSEMSTCGTVRNDVSDAECSTSEMNSDAVTTFAETFGITRSREEVAKMMEMLKTLDLKSTVVLQSPINQQTQSNQNDQ